MRLTYAITPPNRTTPLDRQAAIAAEQSARIADLPVDALLVYDVQDESVRSRRPRPFPFAAKVDPLEYAYRSLQLGALPRVIYRAVGSHDEGSLRAWLSELQHLGGMAVLVGAPSREAAVSLSLSQALAVSRHHAPGVPLGGVVIPERHAAVGMEDARVLTKLEQGCRFFVSQTVWSVAASKRLVVDVAQRAAISGTEPPPLLFTLSPCGSRQTLDFLTWLGVAVPSHVERELLLASDMLACSVELATRTFAELRDLADELGVEVGCNVESLTARPAEIAASVELLQRIHSLMGAEPVPRTPSRESSLMGAGLIHD